MSAGLNVKINLTVTKYNEQDALKICEFANSRNIPLNPMTYTLPPERTSGFTKDDTRLCAADAARTYLKCVSAVTEKEKFKAKVGALSALKLPDEAEPIENCVFPEGADKLKCQAARSSYWITWDGKMLPCVNLSSITAYPLKSSLKEAFDEICAETDRRIRFPKECMNCPSRNACFACPGYFYSETGDERGFSKDLCKYTEHYIKFAKTLSEGKMIDEK